MGLISAAVSVLLQEERNVDSDTSLLGRQTREGALWRRSPVSEPRSACHQAPSSEGGRGRRTFLVRLRRSALLTP